MNQKEHSEKLNRLHKQSRRETEWVIANYVNVFDEKTGKQFIGKNVKSTPVLDNSSYTLRIFIDEDFELRVFRHSERFLERIRIVKIKFDNPNLPVIKKEFNIDLKAHQVIPYILKCESFKIYVKFPFENKGVLFEIKTKGFKEILEKYNSKGNQKKITPSKFKRFTHNHPFLLFIFCIFCIVCNSIGVVLIIHSFIGMEIERFLIGVLFMLPFIYYSWDYYKN